MKFLPLICLLFLGRICIFDKKANPTRLDFEFCQRFESECVRVVALNVDDAKEIAKRAIIARNLREECADKHFDDKKYNERNHWFLQKGKNKDEL